MEENKKIVAENDVFRNDDICYKKCKFVAVRIAKICMKLRTKKDKVILDNYISQIIRSSSSILSNYSEGTTSSISNRDKSFKFNISIKEARETVSWLSILYELEEISKEDYDEIVAELTAIIRILVKSIQIMNNQK